VNFPRRLANAVSELGSAGRIDPAQLTIPSSARRLCEILEKDIRMKAKRRAVFLLLVFGSLLLLAATWNLPEDEWKRVGP
jgi:tRNA A37 threonylcarbamoyladenosine dehydratase